jgi:hypothetical protein
MNDGEIGGEARADVDESTEENGSADNRTPLACIGAGGLCELVVKK